MSPLICSLATLGQATGRDEKYNNDYTVCIKWQTQTVSFCIRSFCIFLFIRKNIFISRACTVFSLHLFRSCTGYPLGVGPCQPLCAFPYTYAPTLSSPKLLF